MSDAPGAGISGSRKLPEGLVDHATLSCVRRPVLPRRQGSDQIPWDLNCTPHGT